MTSALNPDATHWKKTAADGIHLMFNWNILNWRTVLQKALPKHTKHSLSLFHGTFKVNIETRMLSSTWPIVYKNPKRNMSVWETFHAENGELRATNVIFIMSRWHISLFTVDADNLPMSLIIHQHSDLYFQFSVVWTSWYCTFNVVKTCFYWILNLLWALEEQSHFRLKVLKWLATVNLSFVDERQCSTAATFILCFSWMPSAQ